MPKRTAHHQAIGDITAIAKEVQLGRAWIGLSVQSKIQAKLLLRQWEEVFQQWAARYGVEEFRLSLPDGTYMGVPSMSGASYLSSGQSIEGDNKMPSASLVGADYMKILEFLMQARQEGMIVAIVSNTTDICYHTNDLLKPSRAHWSAAQFTGYNYLKSWRADRDGAIASPDFRVNPQYSRLKELLARDGVAPNYSYELFRPDDAKCSYSTSYYLCRDYCGDEVRIGVSRPQDWTLLEPAIA